MSKGYRYILLAVLCVCLFIVLGGAFGDQPATEARYEEYNERESISQQFGSIPYAGTDGRDKRVASENSGIASIANPFSPLYGPDKNMDATSIGGNKVEFQIDLNPTNSQYAVGIAFRNTPPNRVYIYNTSDGGYSWSSSPAPTPAAASYNDPGVAYSLIGPTPGLPSAYIVWDGGIVGDVSRVYVQRTDDNGLTWTAPFVAIDNPGEDRPNIVVDNGATSPRKGWVYVTFDQGLPTDNRQIYGRYSTDWGVTWNPPTPFPIGEQPIGIASQGSSQPRVASDGTLYVGYQHWTNKLHLCSNPNIDLDPIYNVVARSTSWSPGPVPVPTFTHTSLQIIQGGVCRSQSVLWRAWFCGTDTGALFRTFSHPIMSVHPTNPNKVYMVYSGGDLEQPYTCSGYSGYNSDTLFRKSTDAGATWTAPDPINDDPPGQSKDQFFPWMDVAPNGKIWVGWNDRREDNDNLRSRWYQAVSTDEGVTWSESAVADNTTYGGSFRGDYHGLAANDDKVLGMWFDDEFETTGEPFTDPNP